MLVTLMLMGVASVVVTSCGDDDDDVIPAYTHEYVDLGLPSGTLWATCNVGANSPEEYGGCFAWGETTTKDTYDWSTYQWTEGTSSTPTKYTDSSSAELELDDDAAYANWGSEWRMPSIDQIEELINSSYTTTQWTTLNGVYGRLITSLANGNSLFLPAAGWRSNSSLNDTGSYGYYWSRSLTTSNTSDAYYLYFYSSSINTNGGYSYRSFGRSVRPVRALE